MKKLTKGNIIDAKIHTVALVNKGANKKRFFLRKGNSIMNKELALSLIKSADGNAEVIKSCKEQVAEADHSWLDTEIAKLDSSGEDSAAMGVVATVLESISKKLEAFEERLKKQEDSKPEVKTEEKPEEEKTADELKEGIEEIIANPEQDVPADKIDQVEKYYKALHKKALHKKGNK